MVVTHCSRRTLTLTIRSKDYDPLYFIKYRRNKNGTLYRSVWKKKSRRLSFSTLETGEELVKRNYAPGQHGPNQRRKKLSEYGLQLRENKD